MRQESLPLGCQRADSAWAAALAIQLDAQPRLEASNRLAHSLFGNEQPLGRGARVPCRASSTKAAT